ncbi:MAG: plasmid pRiA4b ORF-3 family protein [Methanospirillaceae archaeon]|nr:plasmid pRiA4b ORF-3 family protein [Methanospirillaceae archaeon]
MTRKSDMIFQFKITLLDTKPPIWRRIQVPATFHFNELHLAISDSMGWDDYHLHEFEVPDQRTGTEMRIGIISDDDMDDDNPLDENKRSIATYFKNPKDVCRYVYDFGDYWVHRIALEKILPKEEGISYPRCIKGKRRCPPEDVGGIDGYEELLSVMADPDHEMYEEMMSWCNGPYDPEEFDCSQVRFRNPEE